MALGDLTVPQVPKQAGLMDLAAGAQTGMGLSTGLIENLMRSQQYAQAQRANMEAMKQQKALQAYQQTGGGEQGIAAAAAISPQAGMMLDDRQMQKINNAVGLHDKMKASAYGNLEFYQKEYRPAMIKLGLPPAMVPDYASVEDMNQGLYRNEIMAQRFKMETQQPKVVNPGASMVDSSGRVLFQAPQDPLKQRYTESQIQRNEALAKKANEPQDKGKEYLVVDKNTGQEKLIKLMPGESMPEGLASKEMFKESKVFDEDTLDFEGFKYMVTNKTPPLGISMGKQKMDIMERGTKKAKELGISYGQRMSLPAVYKSVDKALSRVQQQESTLMPFIDTFHQNISIAEDTVAKYGGWGSPALNQAIQAIQRGAIGSPELAALDTALNTVAYEYARITSSPTAGGQGGTRADREEALRLAAAKKRPQDIQAAFEIMKKDVGNRERSFSKEKAKLTNYMEFLGSPEDIDPNLTQKQKDAIKEIKTLGLSREDEMLYIQKAMKNKE